MQMQNTPQFIVKSFKRHYYKAREVAELLAKSDGALKFQYTYENGNLQTNIETPNDELTLRLVVLMRRFLNPESTLYYKSVWDTLKEHFPEAIPPELALQLEQVIDKLNEGPFSFIVNQHQVTAENIYNRVADGNYFGRNDEAAVEFLHNLSGTPAAQNVLYEFYSYNLALFNLASILFDLVSRIERSEQYSPLLQENFISDKRCIYCLSDEGTFTSEEHIVPESIGNYDTVLPKGMVCDVCNNEVLSGLDAELAHSDLLGFLKTLYMPYTKNGKLPQATYPNLTIKKTRPNHIVINSASKNNFISSDPEENGVVHFSIKMSGRKKFDPIIIGRAVYKIGLGMVAFHSGKQAACESKYDSARAFIRGDNDFPNNLLISESIKPHPQITSSMDFSLGGTCFVINIYGLVFIFNLEETPVLEASDEELMTSGFVSHTLRAG